MKPDDPRLPALQKDIKAKTDQTEAYVQSDPTNSPLLTAAADQSFQTGDMQKAQSRTGAGPEQRPARLA